MSEWNGNVYTIQIETVIEASSAEEAQRICGDLLAGRGHQGPFPLTGPGSWAPNVKTVELHPRDVYGMTSLNETS